MVAHVGPGVVGIEPGGQVGRPCVDLVAVLVARVGRVVGLAHHAHVVGVVMSVRGVVRDRFSPTRAIEGGDRLGEDSGDFGRIVSGPAKVADRFLLDESEDVEQSKQGRWQVRTSHG